MTDRTYCITRFYQDADSVVTRRGLTLAEAQAHCQNPETSSKTATDPKIDSRGEWFDGYTAENLTKQKESKQWETAGFPFQGALGMKSAT